MVLQKCLLHNIDHGSQAHSQDVFEACEHIQLANRSLLNKAHLNIHNRTVRLVFSQFLRQKGLTLGLVSTTYMKSLRGLDLKMASSICSSSKQRALKPDRGWLLRQMAAWGEAKRHSGFTQECLLVLTFQVNYYFG